MIPKLISWRIGLALVAVIIVIGTIFYSNSIAKKIAAEERRKVNVWVQALKTRAETSEQSALDLTSVITSENTDIPIVETDENDIPLGQGLNLDTALIRSDSLYLKRKVAQFKKEHEPVFIEINKDPQIINKYYYGDSKLLKQVQYYPIIQLIVVGLFIFITIFAITTRNKSTQNQVWAGMAKETAHQLGTPISSLQGWVEILKQNEAVTPIVSEMQNDINRLNLISDRFGKIGSTPKLEPKNIVAQVENMMSYIKRRASDKIGFELDVIGSKQKMVMISGPLFDWVIENLLKNSLDAMGSNGHIRIKIKEDAGHVIIDVIDTGKGISSANMNKVFKPGFSTKKRGWGLGLSLSKRIIDQYHKGHLFVKSSDPGKGTTFRIVMNK